MNIFQGGYHDTQRDANECKGPRPCGALSHESCSGKPIHGFHQYKRQVERCRAKRAKEAEDIAERKKKGWLFKCGKCGKRFKKQRNLSDHRLRCNRKVCSNSKENHCVPKGGLFGSRQTAGVVCRYLCNNGQGPQYLSEIFSDNGQIFRLWPSF